MLCFEYQRQFKKVSSKFVEAIFVGYSNTNKAYRVFNRSTLTIKESMHIKFEESNSLVKNVVDIDSLEKILKIFLGKTHWYKRRKTCKKMIQMVKSKILTWSQLIHFQRIRDMLQAIPKTSS